MTNLNTPIENIKGVGEKTAKILNKLNIYSYEDLFNYYPRDYEIYESPIGIVEARIGSINSVYGHVASVKGPIKAGRYTIITAILKDGDNTIEAVFFNQPFIKKMIKVGGYYVFRGKLTAKGARLILNSPKMFGLDEYKLLMKAPYPKYSITKGISSKTISKAVMYALNNAEFNEEAFLAEWIRKFELISHIEAIKKIHNPDSFEDIKAAKRRLAFEEFFYFILMLRKNKELQTDLKNTHPMIDSAYTSRFIESLPFKLTSGQKKAWKQISDELTSDKVMNRLVQGDVGSGKTIVAVLALLLCAANGYQGALMAPTEVLASQHMVTIKEYISKYNLPFKPVLLIGSLKTSEKKEAYKQIESGEVNLIIGTHALIQEKVNYKNLALVVTDEQHRFGVRQRESLSNKGNEPHILVMSATPIPRTLAIILYGDLQLSAIHELPANRLPIKNCVVDESYRETAYKFIKDQVKEGRQVYVICSQVEGSDEDDLENVYDYSEKLKSIMPDLRISYLHGKMKGAEKNSIMEHFSSGDIDILVSTTVIEVGINVPNATVMMVENAERFGLAQLHQLRGRVGRGIHQSYCIFVSTSNDEKTMDRLKILNNTNDGFEIASQDLKLRGPGELFGVMQSGELSFKIADIYSDSELLESTSLLIDEILEKDPKLILEEHKLLKQEAEHYCANSEMLRSI